MNAIAAYAVGHEAGMLNSLTHMSIVDYILSAPLTVQVVGSGTVTPNYNAKLLAIDMSYRHKGHAC